jgi:hypothetical protein
MEAALARERAVDLLLHTDAFDAIHGSALAFVVLPRLGLAAQPDQLVIEVVALVREVCAAARVHTARNGAPPP